MSIIIRLSTTLCKFKRTYFVSSNYGLNFKSFPVCESFTKLSDRATNQYFFLAKTTPMHATNSYSLEHRVINNSIYTTSFIQSNKYAYMRSGF